MPTITTRPGTRATHLRQMSGMRALHPGPGVTVTPLSWTADGRPVCAYVQLDAGARAPQDDHADSKMFTTVLYGTLVEEESGTHPPCSVLEADRGITPSRSSPGGCLLTVAYTDRIPVPASGES